MRSEKMHPMERKIWYVVQLYSAPFKKTLGLPTVLPHFRKLLIIDFFGFKNLLEDELYSITLEIFLQPWMKEALNKFKY